MSHSLPSRPCPVNGGACGLLSKLGIATGRSLPEVCRERLPHGVVVFLWLQAELVAMATDLAEFTGATLGLRLVFGIASSCVRTMSGLAVGFSPTRALVLSQVLLSFCIPFALLPLVVFTARRSIMGALVNRRLTTIAAVAVTAVIVGLNVVLLASG